MSTEDTDGRAAARELVAEYENEHGALPAASRQRAREFLAEVGLLSDKPPVSPLPPASRPGSSPSS